MQHAFPRGCAVIATVPGRELLSTATRAHEDRGVVIGYGAARDMAGRPSLTLLVQRGTIPIAELWPPWMWTRDYRLPS